MNMRTYVQVSQENCGRPTYAIASNPEEPFDLEKCLNWVRQYYPDVEIEQLASSSFENARPVTNKVFEEFLSSPLVQIFRLGFNDEEQAAHFAEAWTNPPLDTPDSPSNFIYLTDEREEYRAKGEIDFIVPITGCNEMKWVVA